MIKKIRYLLFVLTAAFAVSAIIHSTTIKRPRIVLVNPENGAQQISEHSTISFTVLNLSKGGINKSTVSSQSVYLQEKNTGVRVPVQIEGLDKGNVLTLVPQVPLKLCTDYTLTVTSAVKDLSGTSFIPHTTTFTTASVSTAELQNVKFEKMPLAYSEGQHTSLTVGPDGKLYAITIDGIIKRFPIKKDGTLGKAQLIYSLQDASGKRQQRLAIGLTFAPSSTADNLVAYITHTCFMFSGAPDWEGKLTRLSGPNLEHVQDVLVNLPRSAKDHLTNSIAFGPDGALYFTQGSTTAMGCADKTWSNREEHLLSAAVLRLDLSKLGALPLDVKTSEGGTYNPYAADAPLTIYASGVRNAYDLVWHSNGELYVPTNGSAAGGNTPASVEGTLRPDRTIYKGPKVPALSDIEQVQKDFLFRIQKGGYYGHPNSSRGEYVMNGGNPTSGADPAQMDAYPVGTMPDANWRGYSFDFGPNKSPNGIIEYKSNAFGGALKGRLLVVRYSTTNDIVVLTPGSSGSKDIAGFNDGSTIEGLSGFVMPLDLTEDVRTGNVYVSELGGERITLLRPKGAPAQNADAIAAKK